MGVARLLAKGWVVFCLFAAAHAFNLALSRGEQPLDSLQAIAVCVFLFGAMGLLFIGGFGMSAGLGGLTLVQRLRPHHLLPRFNEVVFLVFVVFSFVNQVFLAPMVMGTPFAAAVNSAIYFAVPGQHALAGALGACALDNGRVFASATAWLLAVVFVASAVSRIAITAGLLRIERAFRPSSFGPTLLAGLYGAVAIICFQLLFVGSAYPWLGCAAFTDITGAVLIGLAPLMLGYLVFAALATLRASGPEN
ncbi:MAG TPA: hypothetical protein VMU08_07900 [Rhizomicrobium sp.]|nr:hypothetical protein [Rhizomicrobium sp.]